MIYKLGAYLLVWPLRALTPLCFIAFPLCGLDCRYMITEHGKSSWESILLLYSGSEILFYLWFRRALRSAQARQAPPITSRERREEIWQAIQESSFEDENPYTFLSKWFSVTSLARVSKTKLKQWLAWALFDRPIEEIVSSSVLAEIDEHIAGGEKAYDITVPDESPEELPPVMRLNIDPVQAQHRPLIYYAATGLMGLVADAVLFSMGFRRDRVGPVSFWVLKAPAAENLCESPLVFVHGVGIGLAAYLPFLLKMCSNKHRASRPIMLLELPHVSMKLNVDIIPRMDVIAECAAVAMNRHKFSPALWVAHSLGTFVFAAVNRLQSHLVAGVVLLDPVCFRLYESDLLHNFCYRAPETPMQIIQFYHISRELSISYYFHRHFWWHECVLFAKSLPKKTLVYISELDNIYNTGRVKRYLEDNSVAVSVIKGHNHGGFLMEFAAQDRILSSAHLSQL